jgi:hypothetical protein
MQPFDGVSQPQAQPAYPSANSAPQQGQNPQGYPSNRPSYPQNYPSQSYQQPGGYPKYPAQSQPQYVVYAQGASQGSDNLQQQLMAQQLSRNIKSGGGGLVACFCIIAAIVAFGVGSKFEDQTNYQILLTVYKSIAKREFNVVEAFAPDTCQAFLADIIAVPVFLYGFAFFNFFAMCVSFAGVTCCLFVQALAALIWTGIALFASQQKCVGYSLLTTMFGKDNMPQNAWPYYAGMAAASLIACFLNYSWNDNKAKAQRDQRNLALMMAAS